MRTDITRLFRNPPQLALLRRLLPEPALGVRCLLYGVADGAEAVSLLATLAPEPGDPVEIVGRDLDASLLDAARTWTYLPGHAPDGVDLDQYRRVIEAEPGGGWAVREPYRPMLRYEVGDCLLYTSRCV